MGWWIFIRERERSLRSCRYEGLDWSGKGNNRKKNKRKGYDAECIKSSVCACVRLRLRVKRETGINN
jgi:hypothetical protein